MLKIFQPDFWEKQNQYSKEKQTPSDWENLNWNDFQKSIDDFIGDNTTKNWVSSKQVKIFAFPLLIQKRIYRIASLLLNDYQNWKALTGKDLYKIWEDAQEYALEQICKGGKIWNIVDSKLTAEQRDILIQKEFENKFGEKLCQELFYIWQKIIANSRTQGVIWNELSDLRNLDRQELALIERDLSAAEKELESKQQINKLSAQNRLEREKTFIIWKPIRDKLYNLLGIDPEQISNTKTLFNQLRNSPRSYIALACLITLIILGASPSWSERMQILEVVIKSHINTAKVWLIEIYNQYWFFSVPVTGALLQKIWSVSKQYLTEVKQEQIRLENKYQEWVQQAQEEQEILDLSRNIESLRLQAEQKRRQVGLIANQSSLLDFVNNRLQEGSYGQRLGLIHQISHDLEDLSKRLDFTDKDLFSENGKYIRNLFPRGPARVILYIDDLDRCPPDRVVDVLEAVQLLLKTPLFVVVLAIDDRYIARALEKAYEGVLKRKGHPSGIDYLEKIIQIPYRTRPISGSKVEQYLKEHIEIETEINLLSKPLIVLFLAFLRSNPYVKKETFVKIP
ncbi:MAG: P-loop NTPase fold protein [Xenococcus sp. MO_188.B8]|nr:P-loop NTPase fold protein [Xenococcus sp. MO_188.B8]